MLQSVKDFAGCKLLFRVGFPLCEDFGALHLNEDQLVWHHPVLIDFDQIRVFVFDHLLDQEDSFATFSPIQRADIDAGDHTIGLSLQILNYEDFAVTLFEVETLNDIVVVGRILYIWLADAASSWLHSLGGVCGVPLAYTVLASTDTSFSLLEVWVPAMAT